MVLIVTGAAGPGVRGIVDAFALDAGEGGPPGFLAAAGGGTSGGTLSVWQVALDAAETGGGRAGEAAAFQHVARAAAVAPLLRVLLVAPARVGCAWPMAMTLDSLGNLTLWAVQQGSLLPLHVLPTDDYHGAFDPASARTPYNYIIYNIRQLST